MWTVVRREPTHLLIYSAIGHSDVQNQLKIVAGLAQLLLFGERNKQESGSCFVTVHI